MSYVKLFGLILDSSVWNTPPPITKVWIAMMAMADRYGEVQASVPGLAIRARVSRRVTEKALALFLSPDPDSRTPDFEGRRIEKIDGGWHLLNHAKYREMQSKDERREKAAARVRKHRDKKRVDGPTTDGQGVTPDVTLCNVGNAIRSEADADQADPDPEPAPPPPTPAAQPAPTEPWPGSPPPRPPGARWFGADWHKRFGWAWSEAKGRLAYGFGTDRDARAARELDDVLASMPITEAKRAQGLAPKMFAAFLARTGKVEIAGHKFSWFVEDWNALRVEVEGAARLAATQAATRSYQPPELTAEARPRNNPEHHGD